MQTRMRAEFLYGMRSTAEFRSKILALTAGHVRILQ
jgi:hypothetical protein